MFCKGIKSNLVPSVLAEHVGVVGWISRKSLFEECHVEKVGIVVDELEAEHLERETVFEFDLRSRQLCKVSIISVYE